MDKFQAMKVFMRVAEANSFTRAADNLGIPRATVTTTVRNLEHALKVRLLNRTTRSVSLTHDGAAYYERCAGIIADLEETESAFRDVAKRPQGRLRIDVPSTIGRLILIPRLCEFRDRYPEVELVIGMGDRQVDLVREAVDCVIRVGELQDSTLVARRIGTTRAVNCASPDYLERHGTPTCIEDLQNHHAVGYFSSRTGRNFDWEFSVGGASVPIKVRSNVSVNDGEAYIACGLQGFGLIQPPRLLALPHLQSGALVEVLPHLSPTTMPISAAYMQNRHLSPKVRAFVDWVTALFQACPLLGGVGEHHGTCNSSTGQNTLREEIEQANLAECACLSE